MSFLKKDQLQLQLELQHFIELQLQVGVETNESENVKIHFLMRFLLAACLDVVKRCCLRGRTE